MVSKSFNLFGRELFRVERNNLGQFSYQFKNTGISGKNSNYLEMSLTNPVLMAICALRSKIYSQMQIKHIDASGKVIENSDYVKLLNNPNFFQSKEDFFFQQMWFLSATGNNYCYQIKAFPNDILPKSLYNLIPASINFTNVGKINKFITSDKDIKAFSQRNIIYTLDGEEYKLQLSDLIPFYDLSNSLKPNSFIQSESRVRSIENVLANIEENIKAKNINLQMSQKYIASNQNNMQGVATPLQDSDRTAIERIFQSKSMQITNNNIVVSHLVDNMQKLFLDEQFASDAIKCLLAFEMNQDILNYSSAGTSTYENQEKAELRYLQNSIMVSAQNTMNSFSSQFGLLAKGEKLIASYDHLNIMQEVINTKIDTLKAFQETMQLSLSNQTITPEDAKKKTEELMIKLGL